MSQQALLVFVVHTLADQSCACCQANMLCISKETLIFFLTFQNFLHPMGPDFFKIICLYQCQKCLLEINIKKLKNAKYIYEHDFELLSIIPDSSSQPYT